jgi:hypothetical protein
MALAPGLARATSETTLRVRIEATELDKKILLEKLNDNGKSRHLKFAPADSDFDYKIVFATYQEEPPSGGTRSGAEVTVYDKNGESLFTFKREQRLTDTGAANAAAKEIIKRLREL